jgi:hypothetical protein
VLFFLFLKFFCPCIDVIMIAIFNLNFFIRFSFNKIGKNLKVNVCRYGF